MQVLRSAAVILLWVLAAVGVACGAIWAATAAGLIKPLIVISGSMEPAIMTGDLIIAVPKPVTELQPGDVASLPSELSGTIVTHRVVTIELEGGEYRIDMKGDANDAGDALDYFVAADASVWVPWQVIPDAGATVSRMTSPTVAIPLLIGILALVAVVWMLPEPTRRRRAASLTGDDAVVTDSTAADTDVDPDTDTDSDTDTTVGPAAARELTSAVPR